MENKDITLYHPFLKPSTKLLVNTRANLQYSVMTAITKTKQLPNELSYLVMATAANETISPRLAVCVTRFDLVYLKSKLAFNSSVTTVPLYSFGCQGIPFSFALAIDFSNGANASARNGPVSTVSH